MWSCVLKELRPQGEKPLRVRNIIYHVQTKKRLEPYPTQVKAQQLIVSLHHRHLRELQTLLNVHYECHKAGL